MDENEIKNIKPKDMLKPPVTAEYEPPDLALSAYYFHPNRPLFTVYHADAMLADPRVSFGLRLLRGPIIANSQFLITTQDYFLKQFLIEQINRFWRNSIQIALRFLDYGYLGCEVLYRTHHNRLHFDRLKFLHPHHTRLVTKRGEIAGIQVANVRGAHGNCFIPYPKSYWSVHEKDQNIWYGRSRLKGAFLAWHEIWSHQGYRDQRRVWFFKHAYAGPKIGYPPGAAPTEVSGEAPKSYREIATQMLSLMTSGTGCAYPNIGENGWIIEDASPIPIPEGLLEYGDQLRDEIWEGMGIPPEVARADGTGAFAGRRVPQQAFYSILQEIAQDIITDFDEQVLRPLVRINFGRTATYEIECFGLLRNTGGEMEGQVEGPQSETAAEGGGGGEMMQSEVNAPDTVPYSPRILLQRPSPEEILFFAGTAA